MRVIAFIPVRGGSKSIPHKNIKSFLGKPLVYWVVKAASEVQEIDKVVVATDSDEICNTVAAFDLPKVILYDRDPANAQDTSSTESVMLEYISKANLPDEDVFILLQATSPLTRAQDIEEALRYYRASGKDSLLSCVS
ncbi:MAG: hypothetical protein LBQ08_01090, partial [Holosporaceae bacterium]|nr:hypothetical protein [Holosporaceae bacterium]